MVRSKIQLMWGRTKELTNRVSTENQRYKDTLERAGLCFSPPRGMNPTLQYDESINTGQRYRPDPRAPCFYQPQPQRVATRKYGQAFQEAMNPIGPFNGCYSGPRQPLAHQSPSPPLTEEFDMRDQAYIGPGARGRYFGDGSIEELWAARPTAHQHFVTRGQHHHQ